MTELEIYCDSCKEVIAQKTIKIERGESIMTQEPLFVGSKELKGHENHDITVSRLP